MITKGFKNIISWCFLIVHAKTDNKQQTLYLIVFLNLCFFLSFNIQIASIGKYFMCSHFWTSNVLTIYLFNSYFTLNISFKQRLEYSYYFYFFVYFIILIYLLFPTWKLCIVHSFFVCNVFVCVCVCFRYVCMCV